MTIDEFYAKDRATWRNWLKKNHGTKTAIWLIYDKGPGRKLTYDDIVEEALCFGWIDSKPGKVSDSQSKLYICERRPKSVWSKLNKERLVALEAQNLIFPAGKQAIEIAKQNGSWDTLNDSDNLIIPRELQLLLDKNPQAQQNFSQFSPSSKKNILQWIYSAKQTETRQKRVQLTAELAAQNIKANQYRP